MINGKLYFFESGTTTPKPTFSDVNLTIQNAHPVILTAAGRQPNIFFQGVAKAILATSAGVQILVRDPVGETSTTFGNPWVASKDYNANDVVQGSNGEFYVSLINGNVNNNPVTTSGSWTFLYSIEWSAGTTYKLGSVVTYDSIVYQSLQNTNLNQNPSTITAYWVPIQLVWNSTSTYALNANVVGTDGVLYTSIQAANTGNIPASSPLWWVGTSAAAAASAVTATTQAGIATAAAASITGSTTGTGAYVRQTSPTLITPALGTPSSGTVTNLTGTASININGTVGATTPAAGAFTTLSASGKTGISLVNNSTGLTELQVGNNASAPDGDGTGIGFYFNSTRLAGIRNVTQTGNYRTIISAWSGAAEVDTISVSSTGLSVTGTLTASGAITNSAGTANGVAYLNGSKVLTSGSALVFDGTSLATTGSVSGSRIFSTSTSTDGTTPHLDTSASGYGIVGGSASMGYKATSQHIFNLGGGEAMRLNATGLGLGTTSPTYKLDVIQTSSVGARISGSTTVASNNGQLRVSDSTTTTKNISIGFAGDTNLGFIQAFNDGVAYHDLVLQRNGGNLGLGVTPSAWSGLTSFDFGPFGGIAGNQGNRQQFYTNNAYYNGTNWIYKSTGFACFYQQGNGGEHIWQTAPSGTAGNAITFTQAMSLDASSKISLADAFSQAIIGPDGSGSAQYKARNAANNAYVSAIHDAVQHVFLASGTERARIDSDGLKFNGDTAAANALDDYEEGTWTPVLRFGGASVGITYDAQSGTYTKIGNLVTGRLTIVLTSKGSSSGSADISGLPFTVGSFIGSANVMYATNFSTAMPEYGYPGNTTTLLNLLTSSATGNALISDTNFNNNTRLDMAFSYYV